MTLKNMLWVFTLTLVMILLVNNIIYYWFTKSSLEENMERQLKTIAMEIGITIDTARESASFADRLLAEQLRLAAIAARTQLPGEIRLISNEDLEKIANTMPEISGVSLFVKTENDIVSVKSSLAEEIGLSTRERDMFQAVSALLEQRPPDVPHGQALDSFWSSPVDFSVAGTKKVGKWGFYYDGTTDYIICVFVLGDKPQRFLEKSGPENMIRRTLYKHPGILEITLFLPEHFSRQPEHANGKGEWMGVTDLPMMFGSYRFRNEKTDLRYVQEAVRSRQITSYSAELNGRSVWKSFVPMKHDGKDYVIGLAADYESVRNVLNRQFLNIAVIIAAVSLLSAMSISILLRAVRLSKEEAVKATQEEYIDQINRLFTAIRGQRHDFLNHVQTIHSLVKMKRYDALESYTEQFVAETEQTNHIIRIGEPALAALINAKTVEAQTRKIDFEFDFSALESVELGPLSVDIVKILGNLIDNAFDEVEKLPEEERVVECDGYTEQESVIFMVSNPCYQPVENPEHLKRMFESGYSTKSGRHRGLGLAIALERAKAHKGTIEAGYSEEEGMTFRVSIPLKAVKH